MGNIATNNYLNEVQILEHFMEMERRFQRNTNRPFFPSLDYFLDEDKDVLDLLKSQAENMVYFVGLGDKPIKIKIETLENAVAQINLANFSFIDITIDEDEYNRFKSKRTYKFERIFAALAHELGHFILKLNGIWFNRLLDVENEIYADLSTFYLGFGKFVLKGFLDGKTAGYLHPETYAMAYVISEYLNGNDPDITGLPQNIIKDINEAKLKCRTKWIKHVNTENEIKEEYKKLCSPVGTTYSVLAIIRDILDRESNTLGNYVERLNRICLQNEENIPLDCRKAAIAHSVFLNHNPQSFIGEINLKKFIEILALMEIEKDTKFKESFISIKHNCPNCGVIINNPSFDTDDGKRIYHIRCNKCHTQFVVDNDLPNIQSLIQSRIAFINKLIPFCQDDLIISKTLQYQNNIHNLQTESLKVQLKNLKEKEKKWKSLNWWQRLWYKE